MPRRLRTDVGSYGSASAARTVPRHAKFTGGLAPKTGATPPVGDTKISIYREAEQVGAPGTLISKRASDLYPFPTINREHRGEAKACPNQLKTR